MKVEKRDGMIQQYNFDKIAAAVTKVFSAINEDVPEKLLEQLKEHFDNIIAKKSNDFVMPIEQIQDILRDFLIKKNKVKAAETFILYRRKREEIREQKSWLTKEVTRTLSGKDVKNQNANLDEASFGGRIGEAARVVTKDYALKYCMSKTTRKNHEDNISYVHDLDSYAVGMHNCDSIPFDKLLNDGFNTRQTDVRGANSINTAMQLVAVIFQLQSLQQFGGVSATHLDWTMVPYVRKSFEKHYISEYLKELDSFYDLDILNADYEEIAKWTEKGIAQFFIDYPELGDDDFTFANKDKFDPYYYQRALYATRKEVYQAVEGMYHNLNTLQSRSGNQLPFTSINYGTCTLEEGRMITRAIIEVSIKGLGKYEKTSIFPCGIFQYKKGINDKPGTPNYDLKRLALKSSSMRLYPNYANCDWSNQVAWFKKDRSDKQGYIDTLPDTDREKLIELLKTYPEYKEIFDLDETLHVTYNERPCELFSTMGCRTVNGLDVNYLEEYKRSIKAFLEERFDDVNTTFVSAAQKDGRGNIAPATIILPTIAMMAIESANSKLNENEDLSQSALIEEFFKLLEKKMDETKDGLIERFRWIASQSPKSATFMYENGTMEGYHPEEGIISALKHGTLTIGQLGISETLYLLVGEDQCSSKGMELAKRIEKLYWDKCAEYKSKYSLNFGVYYTPAESLCYTAMKKFRTKYGEIENVTYFINENGEKEYKEYFTNSTHVPVYKKLSPFEKVDIESQLSGLSSAGCITYIEITHDIVNNIDALEKILDYMMEKDIPYAAFNVPSDQCKDCHYQGYIPIGSPCPKCGAPSNHIDRLRRVTGYLTGNYTTAFNEGKQDEVRDRVIHKTQYDF